MSDLYKDKKNWDKIIEPDSVNSLKAFKELIDYKELYYRLVRRDFTIFYKQTILGIYGILFNLLFIQSYSQ